MIVYNNFSLKDILYYKIGGKARFVLKVRTQADLLEALEFIKKNEIQRTLFVGLGCKLLVDDNFFDGAVIWFKSQGKKSMELLEGGRVKVFASETLKDVAEFCFKNNLKGLEWSGGLPSSIGGAVVGNTGAFGHEMQEFVDKVETFELSENGDFIKKELSGSDLEYSYRTSLIKQKKNLIVSTVFLKLLQSDPAGMELAKKIYAETIEYRNKNHPMEYPSCGSVFKNLVKKEEVEKIVVKWPEIKEQADKEWYGKISIGYIIGRLGFSNFSMGGAKVSEKQANFIVNFNNAKFDDVYGIINKIKEKFFETFGFYPSLEVEIIK